MEHAHSEGYMAVKGSVIVYLCDVGYMLTPSEVNVTSTTCDGTSWSPLIGQCKGRHSFIFLNIQS